MKRSSRTPNLHDFSEDFLRASARLLHDLNRIKSRYSKSSEEHQVITLSEQNIVKVLKMVTSIPSTDQMNDIYEEMHKVKFMVPDPLIWHGSSALSMLIDL
jgi:hypothetical protein